MKPRGVVSTMSDPEGRRSLGDLVADRPERLFHVGRLDTDTDGLILLTNDGDFAHRLAHPSYEVDKTYVAEVEGLDRGRYAGPVGWIDTQGDGEWAIALRGGLVRGNELQAFAGCGIVRGSEPEQEIAETIAKFQPIREALGG